MKLIFSENAWQDYLYWQHTDKKILKRINLLYLHLFSVHLRHECDDDACPGYADAHARLAYGYAHEHGPQIQPFRYAYADGVNHHAGVGDHEPLRYGRADDHDVR